MNERARNRHVVANRKILNHERQFHNNFRKLGMRER